MKKIFLYTVLLSAVFAVSCSDNEIVSVASATDNAETVSVPEGALEGELMIKFAPEMTDILDNLAVTRAAGGLLTRSGIPSTDEVLDILGAYKFERIFPIDEANEERTRESGLHLWYQIYFDENTSIDEAVKRISQLGEVSKVQCNRKIYSLSTPVASTKAVESTVAAVQSDFKFNDPELYRQWHYINRGGYEWETDWAKAIAGCDVGCEEAWEKCTGDPSIIVAIMDEGVLWQHEDLYANMWVNEGEEYASDTDADNNGYKGDKYGYNFATDRGYISVSGTSDTGHGTHVAGTIAAVNNNNLGGCGIAGGDALAGQEGVKIMICQLFDDDKPATLAMEAKGMKYAADNGAVVLQCSWGYMSGETSPITGTAGPATEAEWAKDYPLEKEAIDYFIANAGSPNGVIDGGIVVYASGNEYAAAPSFPAAYSKCVCVNALAADYTPSTYTNYNIVADNTFDNNISAPGGDSDYYGTPRSDAENGGMVYSTYVEEGQQKYAYAEGTSMACPHVSGVVALGLSYAAQLRKHFTVEEFLELLYGTGTDIDSYLTGTKKYCYIHTTNSNMTTCNLGKYKGKVGKLVNAPALLSAIEGAGHEMKLPNIYVAPAKGNTEKMYTIDLARYFVDGENKTYSCSVADTDIATATVNGIKLTVTGVAVGITTATVTVDGEVHVITITVRENANNNGWL